MMNLTRLAKLGDERDIAIVASNALLPTPWHQAEFSRCTKEEHIRYHAEKIRRFILLANMRVWVTVNAIGRVIGVLVYSREGMGDEVNESIPMPRYPEGAIMKCINSHKGKIADWKLRVLKEVGPHFRGELMAVEPHKQKAGVASGLCKILGRESEISAKPGSPPIPVFFETTSFTLPFHQKFASQYGYIVTTHGKPIELDTDRKEETLVYLMHYTKLPGRAEEPKEETRRMIRSSSPEWQV